jgi:hypothetical protein
LSTPPEPTAERYRPLSTRRRLLILLLAVATAVTLVLTLLDPPGRSLRPRAIAASAAAPTTAPCAEGQSSGCVGGKVDVIVPPPVGGRPAAR